MKHSQKSLNNLSQVMRTSWKIQREKKSSRRQALAAAWAIVLNADIMVYYLVKKHGTIRSAQNTVNTNGLTLFH